MSAITSIEWCDRTWNVVTGCTKVSRGCKLCYAEVIAGRFWAKQYPQVAIGPTLPDGGPTAWRDRQFTDVLTHEDRLLEPLRWRKSSRVFVNSMSDLFHVDVPDAFLDQVFAVMALAKPQTFIVLTKRPERMREYCSKRPNGGGSQFVSFPDYGSTAVLWQRPDLQAWPLPNVWLGVSVEDQATADTRIPLLLETPAAVRCVSYEPALGPVSFRALKLRRSLELDGLTGCHSGSILDAPLPTRLPGLDWIIVGGESGPGARPFAVNWALSVLNQCRLLDVPVFVKQLGANVRDRNDAGFDGCGERAWPSAVEERDAIEDNPNGFREQFQGADVRVHLVDRKGGDPAEWPPRLRVREFPR